MRVNYDQIAPAYDQRYTLGRPEGIAAALGSLARDSAVERILEVGCGTGRWLVDLRAVVTRVYGLDLSLGMLRQARQPPGQLHLICGKAHQLPFPDAVFELVFCVNAIHHFGQPAVFISEARRLLKPGGALAVIGMDPHGRRDHWYIYDYFDGTHETDLGRFPSRVRLSNWMAVSGFDPIDWRLADHVAHPLVGRAVLDDHFLQKHGTSQLALLTDEAYSLGLRRIQSALAAAEAAGETLVFPVDISFAIITGHIP